MTDNKSAESTNENGQQAVLFTGQHFTIRINPKPEKSPETNNLYQIVNNTTGFVEYESGQVAACYEVLFNFEKAIKQFESEYDKLHSVIQKVKPILRDIKSPH